MEKNIDGNNLELTKKQIKDAFYKTRLEQEFMALWKGNIINGSVLPRERVLSNAVLSNDYKDILMELLEETGYWKNLD